MERQFIGGFVPGEHLVFNVNIQNLSSSSLNELSVSLVQKIVFSSSNSRQKRAIRIVASIKSSTVIEAHSNESWRQAIKIPPVISTSNGTCKIIQITYELVLNVNPMGLAFSKNLKIPVIIGTVPINEDNTQTADDLLPPSYEMCVFGSERAAEIPNYGSTQPTIIDNEQTWNTPMTPLYPYFNRKLNSNT